MVSNAVNWQEALAIVEQLPHSDQLRLINELLLRMQAVPAEAGTVDLLSMAGVGVEVWEKIDTDAYLNRERDSWQS